jgi:ribonuclease HI
MEIIVFTDGSFIKTRYGSIGGYGVYFPNKDLPDVSEPFYYKPITNQRTELYAIYKAIKLVTKLLYFSKIHIYTDSEYSIKSLTLWIDKWEKNNWKTSNNKPVKNLDIILKINYFLKKYKNKIFFYHVMSHTGKQDFISKSNEVVDKLAKNGAYKKIEKKI